MCCCRAQLQTSKAAGLRTALYGRWTRRFDGTNSLEGGTAYVEDSTCAFVLCDFSSSSTSTAFSESVSVGGGVIFLRHSIATFDRSTFLNNRDATQAGVLYVGESSSCDVLGCLFRGNEAPTAGVCVVDATSFLSVSKSRFESNRAFDGNGGVFVGTVSVSDSAFVANTASRSGGVLVGGGDFVNANFSSNAATEENGGVAQLSSSSSFLDCSFVAGKAPLGKGAMVYSIARTSITTSSVYGFASPNSEFIIHHEPTSESLLLELDRVGFVDNAMIASIHSTAQVSIRNCPDISNDGIDVRSDLLIGCASSNADEYCDTAYCTDSASGGISCYCDVDGTAVDPEEGSCATSAAINVPERELTVLVTKPAVATATFVIVNKGNQDLEYTLTQLGRASGSWNVTPSAGVITGNQAVQTVEFTLDSTRLQARAELYTAKFSLLSNSLELADRNVTVITKVLVVAEPIARRSYVTLGKTSDVSAGGTLDFHLTLMDGTQLEILDTSVAAYSAVLTHRASNTSVPCSVPAGFCELPELVCDSKDSAGCDRLSPPVGEFSLEVNDEGGNKVGASRRSFSVEICPETYYSSDGKCVACPLDVTCFAGSSISDWQLAAGHWRSDEESTNIFECRFGTRSCPGPGDNQATGSDAYCGPEFVGPLCS